MILQVTIDTIELQWNSFPSSSKLTKNVYKVQYKTESVEWITEASSATPDDNDGKHVFSVSNLEADTKYVFRVYIAFEKIVVSPFSDEFQVKTKRKLITIPKTLTCSIL